MIELNLYYDVFQLKNLNHKKAIMLYWSQFGGNWNNRSKCRSRYVNTNPALNLNSNNSSRGTLDTQGLTLRLSVIACPKGQTHYRGVSNLVGQSSRKIGGTFL